MYVFIIILLWLKVLAQGSINTVNFCKYESKYLEICKHQDMVHNQTM